MLKQRLLVAIPLIIIVIVLLYTVSVTVFTVIASLLLLYAGWEWSAIAAVRELPARIAFLVLLIVCSVIVACVPAWWPALLGATVVAWAMMFVCCLVYPHMQRRWARGVAARVVLGAVCLPVAWWSLVTLFRDAGPSVLLFFLVLVWGADTGAYAAGRWKGKTPLLPAVSPKKSWEGVLGGAITVLVIGAIGWAVIPTGLPTNITFWVLVILTFVFSVIGDLCESLLKRESGVKDSGRLLPGHGGLLDRIDSMIAAAPIFVACLSLLV